MKKLVSALLHLVPLNLLFFPSLLYAASDSSLSFSPPPGDFSVVFLANIFGVVDGVLHGTGSQIMGTMFSIFNSAVLALGGMIIMYTLLVSTMNTAHEGELLGRKWSSIWVPLRSTLGLALLVPKASGYCLMQVFVMWIVVQGVGAADKIWGAALSYLNRGGSIIQKQLSPTKELFLASGEGEIANGAAKILAAQVCMAGLQTILTHQRQSYLESKQKNAGECTGSPSVEMQEFCTTPVPEFISTVNAINDNSPIPMPNFPKTSKYAFLNGICGTLNWDKFYTKDQLKASLKRVKLTDSELLITSRTRDAAVQELYNNLSNLAQKIVGNSPKINPNERLDKLLKHPKNAFQQFGIPLDASSNFCIGENECVGWGSDSEFQSAPLFQGAEFQNAISVYHATMRQSLNLLQQEKTQKDAEEVRKFIQGASREGWIMAGSYFFKLVQLNASNTAPAETIDSSPGLQNSSFQSNNLDGAFQNKGCQGNYQKLCIWLKKKPTQITDLVGLIDGSKVAGITTALKIPDPPMVKGLKAYTSYKGEASSTTLGFIHNSMLLKLADQPGQKPPKFIFKINLDFTPSIPLMGEQKFDCFGKLPWTDFCAGTVIVEALLNYVVRGIVNAVIVQVSTVLNNLVQTVLLLPLKALTFVFSNGVEMIQKPNVNPIVALASMGVYYINVSIQIWIYSMAASIAAIIWPWVGLVIVPVLLLGTPIFFAWVGVMAGVGFITAYYVPFVPYMIFTFGTIAWLMAVIEAMVAAPIVALGITHPEGEGAFGKGEQAIMILFNVFLRPAMMIIGYIAAIALTYVSVWIINAGFSNILSFLQGTGTDFMSFTLRSEGSSSSTDPTRGSYVVDKEKGYLGWAGAFGYFFSILMYTMLYLTVVQKAFTLITNLPDRVLRWISGGTTEQIGAEVAHWGEEAKQQIGKGGEATATSMAQTQGKISGAAFEKLKKKKEGGRKGGQIGGGAGP